MTGRAHLMDKDRTDGVVDIEASVVDGHVS